jgi:hypothetical protein
MYDSRRAVCFEVVFVKGSGAWGPVSVDGRAMVVVFVEFLLSSFLSRSGLGQDPISSLVELVGYCNAFPGQDWLMSLV